MRGILSIIFFVYFESENFRILLGTHGWNVVEFLDSESKLVYDSTLNVKFSLVPGRGFLPSFFIDNLVLNL